MPGSSAWRTGWSAERLLADDGTVIAETVVGEDGKETRSYPYGELFAHVAGYSTMGKTGLESLVNFHLLAPCEPYGKDHR